MTPGLTVAVRTLCEFTAKQGDLDLRFTPSPTALEGIAGHGLVAARRGADWQAERALCGCHRGLQVRGRADGVDAGRGRLEEIKTHKGRLEAMPANHRALHWAQARVYGALLCAEEGRSGIELALVYLDIGSQQETVFTEHCTATALQAFFETLCERYLAWAAQEAAHRRARDAALTALAFPLPAWRAGQRTLAEGVYRAAKAGRCLLAQAPTGIGKTLGTLFPLLKAAPGQQLDKLFFLTAKTSGRALALDALAVLHTHHPGLPLRSLELIAREKACVHPDKACHGDSCPLARGFYDRLPAARAAAVAAATLDRDTLQGIAAAHQVCPYWLGQEMARWADVVVGDYNHWFDLSALLHGLATALQWRVGVLVDEAHNLLDRGRAMYSAALAPLALAALRRSAPPGLKLPLDRLQRAWRALGKAHPSEYQVLDALPERLLAALQQLTAAIGADLAEHPARVDPALQAFYFDALHFTRLAELFDAHALCDLGRPAAAEATARAAPLPTLNIRNVVPAPFLRPRLAAAHTVTLFSATLQPEAFYREMLGLPADALALDVPSPFAPGQLRVSIARRISTRFADRAASRAPLVALMAEQFTAAPGNYLAFFSSHDYLQAVAAHFEAQHPSIPAWKQARRMSEPDQQAFIARLTPESRGIAFVVLGGAFAEGIDLPGARLIGAFIATLGMPQVNPVNEQFRLRLERLRGGGHDGTYLFPGLQKVVQAAGRVIRGHGDRGVVHLMDDRFRRPEVQRLLPRWWVVE